MIAAAVVLGVAALLLWLPGVIDRHAARVIGAHVSEALDDGPDYAANVAARWRG